MTTSSEMDLERAKALLEEHKGHTMNHDGYCFNTDCRAAQNFIVGFVSALESDEVRGLVEALEQAHDAVVGQWPNGSAAIDAENAIAAFQSFKEQARKP